MEITNKIHEKFHRILKRLKLLQIIQTFKLDITFCQIDENSKDNLMKLDSVLKKCLRKIITKPRRAEIRNVITKIVRKKNSKNVSFRTLGNDLEERLSSSFNSNQSFKNRIFVQHNYNAVQDESQNSSLIGDIYYESIKSKKNLKLHGDAFKYKKYLCELCGKIFSSQLAWKYHKKNHSKDSNYKFDFKSLPHISNLLSDCKFQSRPRFIKKNELQTDSVLKNNGNKNTFVNTLNCGKFFDTKKLREPFSEAGQTILHKKIQEPTNNISLKPASFACKCGKIYGLLKTLKKHQSVKHSVKNLEYSCTECKKCFSEKGKLNRHMLSHKKGQFQCTSCLKWFTRSDTLKRHGLVAHFPQKNFSCSFCDKSFKLKYNKDVHEENVHKNKNNWIQCEQCGHKFKNKVTLKSHLKIHFEKQITCNICKKSFTRNINYRNHIKSKHFGTHLFQNILSSTIVKEAS